MLNVDIQSAPRGSVPTGQSIGGWLVRVNKAANGLLAMAFVFSAPLAHADDWIPCDIRNAKLYATTPNSTIEVCSVNGALVYQGRRLSDGATIVLTNVATFPNANKVEAYNEGWTYSLRRDGFHLISPAGVDNYEPWVSIDTWNV
jgi:hypothetical protein